MSDAYALARLSATELVALYRDRTLSPVEVLDAVSLVADEREPELNAFWQRFPGSAQQEAAASEQRWQEGVPLGPLDGVPATIKENIARAGVPMPAGTAGAEPVTPRRSSPISDRLAESGAVVVGSTVMPDWGMLSSGVSSLHGITRSPWNPAWTTGGSSSGAGAAAAAGYAPVNIGSDIGGSIRLPGTWLGLAALKPSAGRIPLDVPYLGRSAGPLTRTVADAALAMAVIARPDRRDWTALVDQAVDWSVAARPADPTALRVGLQLDAGCGMPVETEVSTAVATVAAAFEQAGAHVEPLDPFVTQGMLDDLDTFWRVRSWNDYQALAPDRRERVLLFIRRWVAPAERVSGSRVLVCYQSMLDIQRVTVAAVEQYDVVLSPVAPMVAFPAEWPMPFGDVDSPDRGMAHVGFTAPHNLAGLPAISVNCGFTAAGKPIGVQIAGPRLDDIGVLRAAAWYEAHRPAAAAPEWPIRRPFATVDGAHPPAPGQADRS
jgi:aspartyl-tRNA(Asn)/glutamyl-tRNA(Gln) amidotransferase subunit A